MANSHQATELIWLHLIQRLSPYWQLGSRGVIKIKFGRQTADAATRIIERLKDVGCPAISLVGGLAEPLSEWLPSHVQSVLSAAQSDSLDGAILMPVVLSLGLSL